MRAEGRCVAALILRDARPDSASALPGERAPLAMGARRKRPYISSSWPGLSRPSTSFLRRCSDDVDARERRQVYAVCARQTAMPGHDAERLRLIVRSPAFADDENFMN